jgi:hypothetical protein
VSDKRLNPHVCTYVHIQQDHLTTVNDQGSINCIRCPQSKSLLKCDWQNQVFSQLQQQQQHSAIAATILKSKVLNKNQHNHSIKEIAIRTEISFNVIIFWKSTALINANSTYVHQPQPQ